MRDKITKFEINKNIFYSIDIMCHISDMISDVLHHRRLAQPRIGSGDATLCLVQRRMMQCVCSHQDQGRLTWRIDRRLDQGGRWDSPWRGHQSCGTVAGRALHGAWVAQYRLPRGQP